MTSKQYVDFVVSWTLLYIYFLYMVINILKCIILV